MPPISAKSGRVRKKSFATPSRTSPKKLSSFARATAAQAKKISVAAAVDELVAPCFGSDDASWTASVLYSILPVAAGRSKDDDGRRKVAVRSVQSRGDRCMLDVPSH